MQYLVLTLIFCRPFISSLAYPRANSFYSLCLIALLSVWLFKSSCWKQGFKKLALPTASFILALAISLCFSMDKTRSASELYKYLGAVLLIMALQNLTNKDKKNYLTAILYCGTLISLLAIYQYFVGFRHLGNFINAQNIDNRFVLDYLRQKRVFFPFVTPGILAGYLIMVGPLALLSNKKFLFILPMAFALLLTSSLGAFISLFLTALIYIGLKGDFKKTKAGLLFLLVIFIPMIFLMRNACGRDHLSPMFSMSMRINYWRDTLGIIWAHPFAGIGLGNFNLVYARYAHNSYLQFWAEAGLIGIASLFWLILSVFRSGADKIEGIGKNKEKLVITACLAAFALHNLYDFSFFLPEVNLIWWAILGLLPETEP